jgi:hypothetical protein
MQRANSQRALTNNFNRGNSKLPRRPIVNPRIQNNPNHRKWQHSSVGSESPAAPASCCQKCQQGHQHSPSESSPAAWSYSAVLYIFCECRPLHLRRAIHSGLAAAFFEALHPWRLVQPKRTHIAAHKTAPEYTSGQFPQLPGLQCENVFGRHFCTLADRCNANPAFFACPAQFLAECRHLCPLAAWSPAAAVDSKPII